MMTRILLLLLCSFLSISALSNIDLARCNEDMKCFVRESCIKGKTDRQAIKKLVTYNSEKLVNNGCDVILQIKYYSKSKSHVMVKIDSSKLTQDITETGIIFKQGLEIFKCDKNDITGDPFFTRTKLDIQKGQKTLFCSFMILTKDKSEIVKKFESINSAPELHFLKDSSLNLAFALRKEKFWVSARSPNCDPDIITSSNHLDSSLIYHKLDSTGLSPLTCPTSQFIRIILNGKTINLKKEEVIECQNSYWVFNDGASSVTLTDTDSITAQCVEKFCTLCKPIETLLCPGCRTPKVEHNDCLQITCPNNTWYMDGKVMTTEVTCKQEVGDANSKSSYWYRKEEPKSKVTKAACYDKDTCWTGAKINETCPDDKCMPLIKNDKMEIKCPVGFQMSINSTKLTCDVQTGKYLDDGSIQIQANTNIYCTETKFPDKSASSAGLPMPYVIGCGILFLVFIAIGILCVLRIRKKKRGDSSETMKTTGKTIHLGASEEPQARPSIRASTVETVRSIVQVGPPPKPPPNHLLPGLPMKAAVPWSARMQRPQTSLPDDIWKKFTEMRFQWEVIPSFPYLSQETMLETFFIVTSYAAYHRRPEERRAVGHLRHFFELLKISEVAHMSEVPVWEKMARHVRQLDAIINHVLAMPKLNQDIRKEIVSFDLCQRMRSVLIAALRPILHDLGWHMRPKEAETDTLMRFFCVRTLLWAGDLDVIGKLDDLSKLPLDKLESPMRAVVLAFAVRTQGRGPEIKAKYWKTVLDDPRNVTKDKFGTIRQHILYGLAAKCDGTMAEVMFTEDVLRFLYDHSNIPRSCTPLDVYWAWLGATDYACGSAIDMFVSIAKPVKLHDNLWTQLRGKYPNKTKQQHDEIASQWKIQIVDTEDILAEVVLSNKQYYDYLLNQLIKFDGSLNHGFMLGDCHESERFVEKAKNLDQLFSDRTFPRIFDTALKRIEN